MDALRDIQSVVQIAQEEDRLRNFRYDGSVCSEWSEPHPFIRQCKYVYKKAADAKEYVLSSQSHIPLLDIVILPNKGMWL